MHSTTGEPKPLLLLHHLMASHRFPLFMLFCLLFYSLLMFAVLLVPGGSSSYAAFAESFKIWCFGYDPASGHFQTAYLVMMLVNPLVLALLLVVVWIQPLSAVWRSKAVLFRHGAWALATCLTVAGLLFGYEMRQTKAQPFSVAELRTSYPPTGFSLINQLRQPVQLADFQGQVVLLTGVYATCGYTCPMILAQVKQVWQDLPEKERSQLRVLAITLDPERDSPEMLAALANAQQVSAPQFQFLTGAPETVNATLDHFNFARKRDPETGIIDHANLFLLIDRQNRLAFRFGLGDDQRTHLNEALRLLLAER